MKQKNKALGVYMIGWIYFYIHFAVEVACFYWLYSRVTGWDAATFWCYALLYDCFAFVPQSYIGAFTDRFPKVQVGTAGAVLLLAALVIPWNPLGLAFLTIGNCGLHVAGANATVRGSEGKMGPSGIFVAGGSVGVITGTLLGQTGNTALIWIPIVFLLSVWGISLWLTKRIDPEAKSTGFSVASNLPVVWIVVLTFVVVAARAYVGYSIPTAWKKETWQSVMLFLCMTVGKGLGGVMADRFGARRVAVGSLLLAIPFLLCGDRFMVVSLIGVALFSMTMAISLGALVSVFPDHPGTSFGITTVALFVGTVPAFFFKPGSYGLQAIIVTVLTFMAIVCSFLSLGKKECEGGSLEC